jgi:hypothetical protein
MIDFAAGLRLDDDVFLLAVDDFADDFPFCAPPDFADDRLEEDFAEPALLAEEVDDFARDAEPFADDFAPVDLELDEAFFAVDLEAPAFEPVVFLLVDFDAPVDFLVDDEAPPLVRLAVVFLPAADVLDVVDFLAVDFLSVDFLAVDFDAGLAAVFFAVDFAADAFFGAAFDVDRDAEPFAAAFFGAAFFGAVFFFVAMWSSRDQKKWYDNEFSKIGISMREKICSAA